MDAGPLVAWFCGKDTHHDWAMRTFDTLPTGALVCEAVLAEVRHLAAKDGVPPARVVGLVERNDLVLVALTGGASAVTVFLERYADSPMDFADACVVRLVELHPEAAFCTTDQHFRFIRKNGREPVSDPGRDGALRGPRPRISGRNGALR